MGGARFLDGSGPLHPRIATASFAILALACVKAEKPPATMTVEEPDVTPPGPNVAGSNAGPQDSGSDQVTETARDTDPLGSSLIADIDSWGEPENTAQVARTKPSPSDCPDREMRRLHPDSLKMLRNRAKKNLGELEEWKRKWGDSYPTEGACKRGEVGKIDNQECKGCHIDELISAAREKVELWKKSDGCMHLDPEY